MEPYRDEEGARALVQVREQAGELRELRKERDVLVVRNETLSAECDELRSKKRRPLLMYTGVSSCVLAITVIEVLRGTCSPIALVYVVIIAIGLAFAGKLMEQIVP